MIILMINVTSFEVMCFNSIYFSIYLPFSLRPSGLKALPLYLISMKTKGNCMVNEFDILLHIVVWMDCGLWFYIDLIYIV